MGRYLGDGVAVDKVWWWVVGSGVQVGTASPGLLSVQSRNMDAGAVGG